MTVRPINFSGPMVRALLEGRKTQTRRLATSPLRRCEPGDRLYVRETWAPLSALTHNDPGSTAMIQNGFYMADGSTVEGEISKWTPCIHMPRWASRLTLELEAVRTEPLQAISVEDAIAEGVSEDPDGPHTAYARLWAALHGAESWLSNPDVLVLSFAVHHGNVDGLPA